MTNINTRSLPPYDLLSPAHKTPDLAKRASKHADPLTNANPPHLSQAEKPGTPNPVEAQRAKAREAAEALVATSFIKPILQQLRESNDAAPPFGATQAEKQFGSLLDNQLADEIARASQFPIVDRIVDQFTRNLGDANDGKQGLDINA